MKHSILEQHTHPKYQRLVVDLRSKSRFYQARTFTDRVRQKSMKTDQLATAFKLAEQWYKSLLREQRQHPVHSLHATIAERYAAFHASLPTPKRQADAAMRWSPIRDFWGRLLLNEVTPATFHDFYKWRRKRDKVSNHTLQKDTGLVRQILRYSAEQGLLTTLPFVPAIGKIPNRPRRWLRYPEWKLLQEVSDRRIREMKNSRLKRQRQDCHDFMVFMVHSMMRVEEAEALTFEDCRLDTNSEGEQILICNVRVSKKEPREGVVCYPAAAEVYKKRLANRTDNDSRIFPHQSQRAFRKLLEAAQLYEHPDGSTRNLKSLRATGISFQVLAGVNIVLIANNSGTGINSIQNFYVKHLRGDDDKDALTAIKMELREYRDFAAAKDFVKTLTFSTVAEWKQYCRRGEKPTDIPADPATAYRDYGWRSWDDWLGKPGPDIEFDPTSNVILRWGEDSH
jgi:hypothetical protein